MITCSQCGAQNLPGLAYCENCGSPLPQQSTPAATTSAPAAASPPAPSADAGLPAQAPPQPDPIAAAMPQPVMPVDQPPPAPEISAAAPAATGANLVAADASASGANAVSADAGAIAMPPADADGNAVATPASPAAPVAPTTAGATTLTITFPSGQVFTMQGDTVDVGRADVAQNWHPELDVIPFGGGAPDLGVSRHQARLIHQDGGFVVIDVGSTNGTYINGRAAPYNQSVPLGDGDTLSFGALNTQISIK